MVIDNQIPKTETVYEIKDEYKIPSFEEFMKDYKVDENLNYDDLTYGDISETKGYGPCKVCDRSPYPQWVEMEMSCPAIGCPTNRSGGSRSRSKWWHRGCGGYAIISNRAEIKCSKCSETRHISKWKFTCSEHNGETNESVDYNSFSKALGWVLQSFDCGQVIRDLGIYMTNHDEEWN